MPTRTNRIPRGLLDLTGAETGGQLPVAYDDFLRIGVDATQLYLGETLTAVSQQYTSSLVGSNSGGLRVPAGEAWLLRGVGAKWTSALAGDELQLEFSAEQFPANPGAPDPLSAPYLTAIDKLPIFVSDHITAQANGDINACAFQLPAPMVFQGGVDFLTRTLSQSGAARAVIHYWLFNRLVR